MTDHDALEPCPLCGGEAVLRQDDDPGYPYYVTFEHAHDCMLYGWPTDLFRSFATEAEAITAWNTRARPTLPASFQNRVQPWMMECFGETISADKLERGDRALEEMFELLQSGDYPPERVLALRDYVWGRPKGEPSQEVGGVMVTLAAYCLAHGLDMHEAGEIELARISRPEVVEKIRVKQAAKPTGSALPVPTLPASDEVREEGEASPRALAILKQIDDAYSYHMGDPDGEDYDAAKNAAALVIDVALSTASARVSGGDKDRENLVARPSDEVVEVVARAIHDVGPSGGPISYEYEWVKDMRIAQAKAALSAIPADPVVEQMVQALERISGSAVLLLGRHWHHVVTEMQKVARDALAAYRGK